MTGALDDALREAGKSWRGEWSNSSGDFLVTSVAGEDATTSGPWTILLNGVPTPVGGCSMKVVGGDRVLLARDVVFRTMTLAIHGPASVDPGESFSLLVEDERDGGVPVAGAEVTAGGISATTDSGGEADFSIAEPGRYTFKASHADGIRSNSFVVCVGVGGCAGSNDSPIRILDLPRGARFMRGAAPRSLRGSLRGGTPLVAVNFRGYRGRCRALNHSGTKLRPLRCGSKPIWVEAASGDRRWSAGVGTLPPGRYTVLVRLAGADGKPWRDGTNRTGFTVLSRRLSTRVLVGRAVGFLERATGSRTVRGSGLLAGWSGLALGARGRTSARRLVPALRRRPAMRASTADLARNLAALIRMRGGVSLSSMRRQLISRQSVDGSFAQDPNLTAMAALALPGTGTAFRAAAWLVTRQQPDGGFGASGASSDVDTTGLVAWALAVAGYGEAISRASDFVRARQNPDGGFPAVAGARSNAQSTGLGLIAVRMAGGSRLGPQTPDGITPTHYLASLQLSNGSLEYTQNLRTTPVWVTSQALLGLTRPALLSASGGANRDS